VYLLYALLVLASQAAERSQIRFESHQKVSRVDFILNNSATDDKPVIDAVLGGVALLETLSRDIISAYLALKSPRKNPYARKALARSSKRVHAGGPCLVLPDVFQTDTDLSRAPTQVSPKYLCEEKSVDVEKPESSWGTTGEQLLPNKTLPARTPGFHPPYIIDSEQQGLGRYSLLNRFRE
jgi:hypothetical protein